MQSIQRRYKKFNIYLSIKGKHGLTTKQQNISDLGSKLTMKVKKILEW